MDGCLPSVKSDPPLNTPVIHITHGGQVKSFSQHEGRRIQGFSDLVGKGLLIRSVRKLINLRQKFRSQKDPSQRMDVLMEMLLCLGSMILVGTNIGKDGVISKGSIVYSLFTEEELNELLEEINE